MIIRLRIKIKNELIMVVALEGAVIVQIRENGEYKYHRKCNSCGWVDNTLSSGYSTRSTTSGSSGGFNCQKCHKYQKLNIRG
jgi:hypothetical protein